MIEGQTEAANEDGASSDNDGFGAAPYSSAQDSPYASARRHSRKSGRRRSRRDDRVVPTAWAFASVAAMMMLAAFGWRHLDPTLLDWEPSLAMEQPWRWWSAAFVHYSPLHLWANLAGATLVAALGLAGRVPSYIALAWCVAWPLTHLGLLVDPRLLHYGGLSGVLHAAVALIAVYSMGHGRREQRWLGGAILLGVIAKVALEAPWAGTLQIREGWDFPIAPIAHATGAAAGVLTGLACLGIELVVRRIVEPPMRAHLRPSAQTRMRFTSEVVE